MKINLNNIKVVIFDFDDTFAIHKDKDYIKHRNENEENLLNYYLNSYLDPNTFYESIKSCNMSKSIFKLISILRENNIKIYWVSGMKFSFNLKVKRYFVYKYYGRDIDVISTRNKELKVDAVKIISKVNNCNLNEILFVDDIKDIKIDRRKLSNERVLDLLAKVENPYVFKINAHLIQIGFTNNGKTAEDCLTNVLE